MTKALLFIISQAPLPFLYYYLPGAVFVNYELAFFSSALILFGSMIAFSKVVMRASAEPLGDVLQKIDDPHDLYDDETEDEPAVDAQSLFEQEKKKIKKFSLKGTYKATPALFSFFRMVPYVVFIAGMIALANNELFDVAIFLFGITMGILCAILCLRDAAYGVAVKLFNDHRQGD